MLQNLHYVKNLSDSEINRRVLAAFLSTYKDEKEAALTNCIHTSGKDASSINGALSVYLPLSDNERPRASFVLSQNGTVIFRPVDGASSVSEIKRVNIFNDVSRGELAKIRQDTSRPASPIHSTEGFKKFIAYAFPDVPFGSNTRIYVNKSVQDETLKYKRYDYYLENEGTHTAFGLIGYQVYDYDFSTIGTPWTEDADATGKLIAFVNGK